MDPRWNLHGRILEFAWTHFRICMDARRNLHGRKREFVGQITEFAWTQNFYLLGQKNHIYIFVVAFVLLSSTFYLSRSRSAAASYCAYRVS